MDAEELKKELKAGKIAPVYVVYGAEELLKREALALISEKVLAGGIKEFNETKLLWKETTAEKVVDACRTSPMMGGRRLVLVKGADGLKAADSDVLAAYLHDPSPVSTLVVEATAVDARLKWMVAAKKAGAVLKLDPPYANKMPMWIGSRVRSRGAGIEPQAATLLADVVGTDLAAADEAIERLLLYTAPPGGGAVTIKVSDVEACVARTRVHSIFELTDALGQRSASAAMGILLAMLDAREQPIPILGMIARHFRRLWEASDALRSGASPEEVGRKFNMHAFFLSGFIKQARMFDDADYGRLFDRLYATDRALKSSRADPELHLMRLVLDVCGAG